MASIFYDHINLAAPECTFMGMISSITFELGWVEQVL